MSVMTHAGETNYWISHHIHLCPVGDGVVFLDLKHDRYIGLGAADIGAWTRRIAGWPLSMAGTGDATQIPPQLLEQGVVTDSDARGKHATPVEVREPLQELIEGYTPLETHIRAIDVWRFACAALSAQAYMKYRSMERIAAHASRRPGALTLGPACEDNPTLERLRHCVALHERLRPLFFSSANQCLLDSLVMRKFLGCYRLYPDWVFGVRTKPFRAHCWLQWGNKVIADSPEHVRQYRPIMVL